MRLFAFYGLNEQVKPDGEDCQKVDINFGAARATLTYDEAKKGICQRLKWKIRRSMEILESSLHLQTYLSWKHRLQ